MTATATRPTTDAPARRAVLRTAVERLPGLVPWSWVVVTTEDDG
jgi:hypothetical protein